MVIHDRWDADGRYEDASEELDMDVAEWPPVDNKKLFTLRLEELTHFDVNPRIEARERNRMRLNEAKTRTDIAHLEVHYTCCVDKALRVVLEELLTCDEREWVSFTLKGINETNDFYTKPNALQGLSSLFIALRVVKILNLHSCTLNRGHGLDSILPSIPFMPNLRELRLQGWQMDPVSVALLMESLEWQKSKSVSLLSLRSCSFIGETTFQRLTEGLANVPQLNTLNLSYCNLRDDELIPLIHSLRDHPSIECLHIGGNSCITAESVEAISEWLSEDSCRLRDLNLRALWIGYSDLGLLERVVDLGTLFEAIAKNDSLQNITLSENYLETDDVKRLIGAFPQKTNISFLDLGMNPFQEKGAQAILTLVRECTSIEVVRFENDFTTFGCADAIKTHALFNYVDRRLMQKPCDIPLSVWPRALSRVQEGCDGKSYPESGVQDILFRLLRAQTGQNGLPLSFRIAINRKAHSSAM